MRPQRSGAEMACRFLTFFEEDMAAGATVMCRKLGGSALYHGKTAHSVILGYGSPVTVNDIPTSLTIVTRACLLLLAAVFIFQLILYFQ